LSFQQGGLQAFRDTQIHKWQLRYPGGMAEEDRVLQPKGREEGQTGSSQRGERLAVALMLLSIVGYLQEDKEGKHTGYPKGSSAALLDPTAGAHTAYSLNKSNVLFIYFQPKILSLFQAFLVHLSYCLCDKI
jgi:hypothetical protein